jgi:hypothetical protein
MQCDLHPALEQTARILGNSGAEDGGAPSAADEVRDAHASPLPGTAFGSHNCACKGTKARWSSNMFPQIRFNDITSKRLRH